MTLDPEFITRQLTLLAQHRERLTLLFVQQAKLGVYAPPYLAIDVREAQQAIRSIKTELRARGRSVEDHPDDERPVPLLASLAPALHQLRPPVGDFIGRAGEVEQLVRALGAANGAAATITGVRGMGGIGKTELAYAVAQRLAAQFPDAQLLIELRGASDNSLTPAQALQTAIRAFEREAKLPDEIGQLQAIYRDKLTGKRVLILADDARDAVQVRPLLPPHGCALLVTSRNHFELPGMQTFDLRTLSLDEAEKLLLNICPRIGASALELARLCGYLPLALRVSASLLASRATRRVEAYLRELLDQRTKLAHLRDPRDHELDVEASLQLSFDALDEVARTALLQLSVFPISFDLAAAERVVAVPPSSQVADVLEDLCRLSLLEWDAALERYSLHDLVRAFAAARLDATDPAWLRHARHYMQVASRAQFDLYLKGQALAGLRVFDRERAQIDAGWAWAVAHAGEPDADALLLAYPDRVREMANMRYDLRRERIPQLEAQRAAAQRLGRRDHEGYALGNLGIAYANLGEARKAIEFHQQKLMIYREIGDRRAEGVGLGNLGIAYWNLGEIPKAIEFYQQALAIHREVGDRRSEGLTLGNLGNAYNNLSETPKAIEFSEQGLVIYREVGDRRSEGQALMNLGLAYSNLGETPKAIEFYQQALVIHREIGNRSSEAITNWNLGLALEKQGDLAQAAELMQTRVDFLREIGHPDAEQRAAYLEQVRQRLADRGGGG